MQSLFLKSMVLMTVIGGSCYVVWQAHESLQVAESTTDPNDFAEFGIEPDASTDQDDLVPTPASAEDPKSQQDNFQIVLASHEKQSEANRPSDSATSNGISLASFPVAATSPHADEIEPTPARRPKPVTPDFEDWSNSEESSARPPAPVANALDLTPQEQPEAKAPLGAPAAFSYYSATGKSIPNVTMLGQPNQGAFDPDRSANEEPGTALDVLSPTEVVPEYEPTLAADGSRQSSLESAASGVFPSDVSQKESRDASSPPMVAHLPIASGFASEQVLAPGQTERPQPSPELETELSRLGTNHPGPALVPPSALPTLGMRPGAFEREQANLDGSSDERNRSDALALEPSAVLPQNLPVANSTTEEENPFSRFRPNLPVEQNLTLPGENVREIPASNSTAETGSENPFSRFRTGSAPAPVGKNLDTNGDSQAPVAPLPEQALPPHSTADPFASSVPRSNPPQLTLPEVPSEPVPLELLPPVDLPAASLPATHSPSEAAQSLQPVAEKSEASKAGQSPSAKTGFEFDEEILPNPAATSSAGDSLNRFPSTAPSSTPESSTIPTFAGSRQPAAEEPRPQSPASPISEPTPISSLPEIRPAPQRNPFSDERNAISDRPTASSEPTPANRPTAPGVLGGVSGRSLDPALSNGSAPQSASPNPFGGKVIPAGAEETARSTTPSTPASSDSAIGSGPQSPELKIEKLAPPQASIGDPLIYAIRIQNVGGSPARSVVVEDRIPRGTRLEGTIPQAVLSNDKLTWELGTIPAGEERTIRLKVIPTEAGDIGSVATVTFEAAVAATIRVTAPELAVEIEGPAEALVGKNVPYKFVVKNTGQGQAKDVVLRAILPPGLKHPSGDDIEADLGDIPAGQTKTVDLVVVADQTGIATPKVLIWMNGKNHAENRADLRVIESRLKIVQTGPKRRFVGRPAQFRTQVTNDSISELTEITVLEQLPAAISPSGAVAGWDPQRRVIQRTIPSLKPGETREFVTEVVATQAGELVARLIAQDRQGNAAEIQTPLSVKGFSELEAQVRGSSKVVAVGDQVSMRLNLKNDGTASARNVKADFEIPPGLVFMTATGPSTYRVVGNRIQFDPVDEVGTQSEQTFDIVLTAAEVCNTKVKVALHSSDYEEPIHLEEPLRVISDLDSP